MKNVMPTQTAAEPVATTPPTRREASELWTDEVCAEYLSVEPRTLRLWRNTRGLPFIRITSKVIRYRQPDVEGWLDRRRCATKGRV